MNDDSRSDSPRAAGYSSGSATSRRANLYLVGDAAVAPNRGLRDQSGTAPQVDPRNPIAARVGRPTPPPGSQRASSPEPPSRRDPFRTAIAEDERPRAGRPVDRRLAEQRPVRGPLGEGVETQPLRSQAARTEGDLTPRADASRPLASPLGTLGRRLSPHSTRGADLNKSRTPSRAGSVSGPDKGSRGPGKKGRGDRSPKRMRGPLLWLGPIAAVMLGLGVLVYPIQNYLAMRESIAGALAEQHALENQRSCLEDAVGQLERGDSLTLEARQRFGMVEPGNVVVRSTTDLPEPVASSCLTAAAEPVAAGPESLPKSRRILNALSEFFIF